MSFVCDPGEHLVPRVIFQDWLRHFAVATFNVPLLSFSGFFLSLVGWISRSCRSIPCSRKWEIAAVEELARRLPCRSVAATSYLEEDVG